MKPLIALLCLIFSPYVFSQSVTVESLECTVTNAAGVSYFTYNPEEQTMESSTYSLAGHYRTEFKLVSAIENKISETRSPYVQVDLQTANQQVAFILQGRLTQGDKRTLFGSFGRVISGQSFLGWPNFVPHAVAQCHFVTSTP